MIYNVEVKDKAVQDIALLKKSDPIAARKVLRLLGELKEHPYTGSGKPEALKYDLLGYWSRRISQKHRLIYQVLDNEVLVIVFSAVSHYSDK